MAGGLGGTVRWPGASRLGNAGETEVAVRALIVDYGGVLIRLPSAPDNIARIAAQVGLQPTDLLTGVFGPDRARWREARTGALSEAELWAEAGRLWQRTPDQVDWVRRQLFDDVRIHTELVRTLWRLRPKMRLALVSNALPSFTDTWRRLGFLDLFHVALNSSLVGMAKPDRTIFHLALGSLGVGPEACICIDDQQANLEAAAALGMRTVHFRDEDQTVTALLGTTEAPQDR